MNASILRHASRAVIAAVLIAAGTPACSSDDSGGTTGAGGTAGAGAEEGGAGGAKSGAGDATGGAKGGMGGIHHGAGGATATDGGTHADGEAPASTAAADLRVTVNLLLSEHLIFAAKATGAALGGRTAEFAAYGDLLNTNGTDLGALVGAAFGAAAKTQFNSIWSAHNGFFVDYTTGVATKDQVKQDRAVKDLTETYVPAFAALISGATGLPRDAVAELTLHHVLTTKDIVDAQAAEDWPRVFTAVRGAFAHMQMIGDPLSLAIAGKLPEAFPGDAATKAADFRVALNELLQEHLYLATLATGAALGGRTDEFGAAGDALNANGTDLGLALGGLYGADARTRFNSIWSAHNGFFVDYTTGVATKDNAKQARAVKDLTETYVPAFAAFLASATDLPEDALASLTTHHVLTTKEVVDDQAGTDFAKTAAADRMAGQHMQSVGDSLAFAIVAKLPAKF